MARPLKQDGKRRCVIVRVRMTEDEKARLFDKATRAGATLSDWIRSRAIGADAVVRMLDPDRALLLALLAEMGKQGSNLNKVSRHLNRKQNSPDFIVPVELVAHTVQEIRTLANRLRDILDHGHQRGD